MGEGSATLGEATHGSGTRSTATGDERGTRSRRPTYNSGARVGRYVISERIAEGGMGVVYRARDPELDRDVALKVLRVTSRSPEGAERARARLLREAQALAQLSHPNVVAAHDVGASSDDVFVAMELVEGVTLREWLRSEGRSLADRLAVLIAAGKGLAAAHAAGLVHRDFKPANVLVGSDGRVRVADFGLARTAIHTADTQEVETESDTGGSTLDDAESPPTVDTGERSTPTERLSAPLTIAGAVLGTPGYMSPEQYNGGALDAHTDQFSFCVTLHEAVYGVRPFRGTPAQVRRQIVTGAVTTPPEVRVPGWLRRAIERGLAVDRRDRFPSMDALLAELSRNREARRLRVVAVAAVALVIGGGTAFGLLYDRSERVTCGDVGQEVHQVVNDDVGARLRQAFATSGRTYADATSRQVSSLLGNYANDWATMRVETCRATRVRGDQSERVLDLRIRCLDRGLGALRALIDELLAEPDGAVVDRAVRAALDLPPVGHCADFERLTAEYPPPDDPRSAAAIDEQYAALDRATALHAAGRYERGLATATDVVAASASIDYAPLRARALLRQGRLQMNLGQREQALVSFRDAAAVAGRARSDALLAETLIEIYYLTGPLEARYAEAGAISPAVDAVIARAGDRPEHRADALAIRGYVLLRTGDAAAAVKLLSAAHVLFVEAYGPDHPHVAHALSYLSMGYNEVGRFDDSSDALARSIAINEQRFGADHPMLIAPLNNLGTLLVLRGEYQRAVEAVDRALAIAQTSLPADHPKIGIGLTTRAEALIEAGRCDQALPALHRALKIFEDKLGVSHENVGYPLTGLGRCAVEAGRAKDALPLLERAEALRAGLPASDPERARTSFWIARAMWQLRRNRPRAIERATAAHSVLAAAGPTYAALGRTVSAWIDSPR